MEKVILVNELNEETGVMEKMEVHLKGLLHRAFSIFIFNEKGEMLLQQRSFKKYHSGGLWSNACCGHPRPGEVIKEAAQRRLYEELGFITTLEKSFDFIYKTTFNNGLTEYEFDHVFTGNYNGEILPAENEINDFCYRTIKEISASLQSDPAKYTEWFSIAFQKLLQEKKDLLL